MIIDPRDPEGWIRECYPVEAKDVPITEALAHSIQKWKGLRKSALAYFGLTEPPIEISGETCALCHHYDTKTGCDGCPLAETLGMTCDECDEAIGAGPYWDYKCFKRDPEPMIKALEETLRREKLSKSD